ncbi:Calx-beta domain-containing protein [Aquimarina algiphila]|uniref:Calx-beta domain-containing protein n=1 Tax=Aquimarina algiphila TaxID=2047982 RepID=UPI00232E412C|nr:Calx-beta domain-containing protein [Aquimarina algiphila]
MKKLLLISFVFLLGNQVINAQTTETEPNNSVLQSGVLTVSSATTITGDVCLGGGCPTADPSDHWIIADGSSGTFMATWSDNVVVTLFTYDTSARNTAPSSVTLSSGVSQTLSASSFYSLSVQFNTIGVLTSYSVALSGTSLATPPSVPSVNHGPPIICSGNSALLTWTGNLNDATEWHIYTGSCGGTEIDTTTGNSVIVAPPASGSVTYFVRGEGGGVTPGACGSHTITITAREDANFSYSATSYLPADADPTPTITGVTGGDFTSSPSGLSIDMNTGTIDVSASTPGMYTVTYETPGLCSGTEDRNITITDPNANPIIQIGTDTNSSAGNTFTPWTTFFEDGRRQYLITASELLALGLSNGDQLYGLAFNVISDVTPSSAVTISLKSTTDTEFSTFAFDNTGFTEVFNGNHDPNPGWDFMFFDTPYTYDGNGIIINFCFNNTRFIGNSSVQYSTTTGNSNRYSYTDNTDGCTLSSFGSNTNRANIQFSTVPDIIDPSFVSITRQTPVTNPTNADGLVFRAIFNEPVQFVDAADFDVTGTTTSISNVSGSGTTYDITVSGVGDLANLNGAVGINLSSGQNIQDLGGNALPNSEPTTDQTYTLDNEAPNGYSVTIDQSPINTGTNDNAVSFTFAGAEVGATYNYSFSSSGGAGTVTNNGAIATATDQITGIDLSGLADGTITLSVTLNDMAGNTGTAATDTEIKNTIIRVSVNDPSIAEGNAGTTTLQFTVNLDAPALAGGATVDYATSNGSATAGSDYTAISTTTLSFLAGESSKTVDITITGDQTVEIDETLTLTLSNPTGTNVIIGDSTGTGTITNDDQATVTIADVALNENSGTATITVIVDNAVDGGFDVDVSTADGTATTADSDYTAVTAQTLTFAGTAGESETFNITLGGDTKVEADETTSISMSGLSPVTVASGDIDVTDGATLTINNDDQATVTIANVSGNEDDGAITVTVVIDNAIDGGFDVDVSTADGTATTANSDYTAVTAQTLTFAGTAGETETFTITPTADATSEPDETVIIGMSGLSPSTVASGDINITDGATLTIFNDDDISISVNDPSIAEGNSGTTTLQFTVNLNAPAPAGGATVDYATSNGSATAGSDYTAISTTTLSFLAGESSKTVDITITGDQTVEIDETLTLTLSNPTGTDVIIGDATGTATITNDDQATVTIADVALNENSGTATITVIVDNAVDGGFDVDVSTADGTATTADSDYTAVTAQILTFAGTAGESETFNITLGGDTKVEADETASISMSGLSPGTVASGDIDVTDGATLTINNDDQATVTIANVSGNEDDGAITVTVVVDNAIDGGFDVDVSTADGTATTANSDYTAVTAQTLTFAGTAGETETFTITPTADATSEPDETVIIGMSGLSPSTVASGDINITDGATLTILNDDAAVLSIVATTQAAENTTNGLFTISTTNQFSTPVTVNLSVTGTATSGTDFTALGTTFIFPANTNSATINVPVIADNLVESNETVIVTLTGTNNGIVTIGSADNATVTITDDDVALLSITATTQAEEGTTNGVYTVSTTNEFSTPVMVTISTTGTAISGTDYDDLGSSFMFPANTSSMTIPLSVIDDNIVELDETVILTMTNTNNTSATIGTTDEATITITDPDIATITIEDVNANEDDGAITIIATLDNEVPGGFTVDVNTTDGTATIDDNDYTAIINQTLSFTGNAGETQTFTILPTEDATPESDETVTVTLSNVANTSLEINSTDSALITILNDDDLDIRIYPNPTAGEVNINIPLNLVLVYNVTGKKVFETKNNSFSIANLPTGIYFIRIKTINGSIERKLIKL